VLPLLLQRHPAAMKPRLRQWARGGDLWFRRAAMLAQRALKKKDFDAVLLYDCILPSVGDPQFEREFFIRKGMGWALRERSYAAPDEVQAFCNEYAARLSPLTVREALKAIQRAQHQVSRRGTGSAGPRADGPLGE
jgi:3-methyladenine DNA glycosylase AlkD